MTAKIFTTKTGATYERTDHKVGSRLWGHFRTYTDGRTVYVARRTMEDLYRGDKGMSEALRDGTAAWALDEATIQLLRLKKVQYVVIAVENKQKRRLIESRYITPAHNFMGVGADKVWKMHNYRQRSGSFQRWVSLQHFVVQSTEIFIGLGA